MVMVATRKGLAWLYQRCEAAQLARRRAAFSATSSACRAKTRATGTRCGRSQGPGHSGPTISVDRSRPPHWKEVGTAPAFPPGTRRRDGPRAVDTQLLVTPGHVSEPKKVWYAGT